MQYYTSNHVATVTVGIITNKSVRHASFNDALGGDHTCVNQRIVSNDALLAISHTKERISRKPPPLSAAELHKTALIQL